MTDIDDLKQRLHARRKVLLSAEDISTSDYKQLMSDQSEEDAGACGLEELQIRLSEMENPWCAQDELAGMFPNGPTDDDGYGF
jgi:hypothetical protein